MADQQMFISPKSGQTVAQRKAELDGARWIDVRNLAYMFHKKADGTALFTYQETLNLDRELVKVSILQHELQLGLIVNDGTQLMVPQPTTQVPPQAPANHAGQNGVAMPNIPQMPFPPIPPAATAPVAPTPGYPQPPTPQMMAPPVPQAVPPAPPPGYPQAPPPMAPPPMVPGMVPPQMTPSDAASAGAPPVPTGKKRRGAVAPPPAAPPQPTAPLPGQMPMPMFSAPAPTPTAPAVYTPPAPVAHVQPVPQTQVAVAPVIDISAIIQRIGAMEEGLKKENAELKLMMTQMLAAMHHIYVSMPGYQGKTLFGDHLQGKDVSNLEKFQEYLKAFTGNP